MLADMSALSMIVSSMIHGQDFNAELYRYVMS